jgi:hypothetical protein
MFFGIALIPSNRKFMETLMPGMINAYINYVFYEET